MGRTVEFKLYAQYLWKRHINWKTSPHPPKEEPQGSPLPKVQFSSVAQSCPTLCDPMNRSTPGLPVHHQLPEFTQTHVHRVSDAIAYWAPTDLGSSSFSILSFCLFILFMGFSPRSPWKGPLSRTATDAAMKGQQGALLPCFLPGRPPGFETHAPY